MATEKLQITKENAVKAFNETNDKGKKLLNNLFGEETFITNIMDRVKTYEDACDVLGEEYDDLPYDEDNLVLTPQQEALNATYKITIIARALNGATWIPVYAEGVYKYYPYFDRRNGGFVFNSSGAFNCISSLSTGLLYKSRELSDYAGKQFIDIYKKFL